MNAVIPNSLPTRRSAIPIRIFTRAKHAISFASRALRECFDLVRREQNSGSPHLALDVLRYRAKQFLLKISPHWHFRSDRLFKWRIEYFDFLDFLNTFEIIFLMRDYRFQPASRRPLILDCGSNIGLSIFYFKREFPESTIVAFEPEPETFRLLRKNVDNNHLSGIELRNQAVCGTPGPVKFYYDQDHPGNVAMSTKPQCRLTAVREVEGVRLTDVVNASVDLLKLDVEGAELEVIEDLAERGKISLIKEMLLEYHPVLFPQASEFTRMCSLLERNGFQWQVRSGTPPAGPLDVAPVTVHAWQERSQNQVIPA